MRVIRFGEIITSGSGHNLRYLDQLVSDSSPVTEENYESMGSWIHYRCFPKYIFNTHGLSMKQYVNIIIYGIDKDEIPLCPICNSNKLDWAGNSRWTRMYNMYCNDCRSLGITATTYNMDPVELAKYWYVDKSNKRKYSDWNDPRVTKRRLRTSIINLGKDKIGYLYFISQPNICKFGVTFNLLGRMHSLQQPYFNILFKGSSIELANVEYFLKGLMKVNSEYLDIDSITLDDIYSNIKLICNRLKYPIITPYIYTRE